MLLLPSPLLLEPPLLLLLLPVHVRVLLLLFLQVLVVLELADDVATVVVLVPVEDVAALAARVGDDVGGRGPGNKAFRARGVLCRTCVCGDQTLPYRTCQYTDSSVQRLQSVQ